MGSLIRPICDGELKPRDESFNVGSEGVSDAIPAGPILHRNGRV